MPANISGPTHTWQSSGSHTWRFVSAHDFDRPAICDLGSPMMSFIVYIARNPLGTQGLDTYIFALGIAHFISL